MTMIKDKLIVLEKELGGAEAPCLGLLRPGADRSFAELFVTKLFDIADIHPELLSFPCWKDGTEINSADPAARFWVFRNFFLLSMNSIKEIVETDQLFEFKNKKYYPLLASGHGEYLVVNLDSFAKNPAESPVYMACTSNPDLEIFTSMYDNVYAMLDTAITGYQKSIYFTDRESKTLDYDFDADWDISAKMNPNSTYWKR